MFSRYLFVYGTLRWEVEHPASDFVNKYFNFIAPGYVYGSLYLMETYPMVEYNSFSEYKIWGDLLQLKSEKSSFIWKALDEYEGEEYEKIIVPVFIDQQTYFSACYVRFKK